MTTCNYGHSNINTQKIMPGKPGATGTAQGAQAALRDRPQAVVHAFKKSSCIRRSPEQLGVNQTQERSQSSPSILQKEEVMTKKGQGLFAELGEKIAEVIEMMTPNLSASPTRTIQ